jgi:hypothetical protein
VSPRPVRSTAYGPVTRQGDLTVIPAAVVTVMVGGGGGVKGPSEVGGGLGLVARERPVGALVLRGNRVTWRPAVDVWRIALASALVAYAWTRSRTTPPTTPRSGRGRPSRAARD